MTLAMEMARRLFLPLATEGLEEEDEAEANEQRKICMYFFFCMVIFKFTSLLA